MASSDTNLADRTGNLVESHKGYDPRIVLFYFIIAILLVILAVGLGYQQLHLLGLHSARERQQTQRRIVIPAPRGNIYDRNGNILVTNSPRWTVVLHLEELKSEFYREQLRIGKNYRDMDPKDVPSKLDLAKIARVSVAQRYLDHVNRILHREGSIDAAALQTHFRRELLKPYTLLDGLDDEAYARLLERLPVNSPVQVYATSVRNYVYGPLAAHTLGRVKPDPDIDIDDLDGEGLHTFKMHDGATGILGLEKSFDAKLQGEAGGRIVRVDPSGYKIDKPITERAPKQGQSIVTSLDLDLQRVAEEKISETENEGSAVALDVNTGEVLVLASQPSYNPNLFTPRISHEDYQKILDEKAEFFGAVNGTYSPGSTFKLLVSVAGLRSGKLLPNDTSIECTGTTYLGRTAKTCDNGHGHHGRVNLAQAIGVSCDIYYYLHGIDIGPKIIADEARRFHLDQRTGIELPDEHPNSIVPDPDWKRRRRNEGWTQGDTANMAIGQGDVQFSPLQMACFAASLARNELTTKPTLLHDPNHPTQHTEPIGLTPEQRAVLLQGMRNVVTMPGGTATQYVNLPSERVPGVDVAGKTGTAEVGAKGDFNVAWFICFAPVDKPEIAVAVAVRSNERGDYGGGRNAAPVAFAILRSYFDKKNNPQKAMMVSPFKAK
jgi:penicillin-binding protein 2